VDALAFVPQACEPLAVAAGFTSRCARTATVNWTEKSVWGTSTEQLERMR
jgi:hypothetical protein